MFFENKKADPDHLKGSPSLLRLLFFHYPQHHSRTQLKAVLEDQFQQFPVFFAGGCVILGWLDVAVPKFFKDSHTAPSP